MLQHLFRSCANDAVIRVLCHTAHQAITHCTTDLVGLGFRVQEEHTFERSVDQAEVEGFQVVNAEFELNTRIDHFTEGNVLKLVAVDNSIQDGFFYITNVVNREN